MNIHIKKQIIWAFLLLVLLGSIGYGIKYIYNTKQQINRIEDFIGYSFPNQVQDYLKKLNELNNPPSAPAPVSTPLPTAPSSQK